MNNRKRRRFPLFPEEAASLATTYVQDVLAQRVTRYQSIGRLVDMVDANLLSEEKVRALFQKEVDLALEMLDHEMLYRSGSDYKTAASGTRRRGMIAVGH